jgi:hypothetical protein
MRPTCHLDSVPRRSTKKSERDLVDDAGMPTADLTEKRGYPRCLTSAARLRGALQLQLPFRTRLQKAAPLSAGVRWYVP